SSSQSGNLNSNHNNSSNLQNFLQHSQIQLTDSNFQQLTQHFLAQHHQVMQQAQQQKAQSPPPPLPPSSYQRAPRPQPPIPPPNPYARPQSNSGLPHYGSPIHQVSLQQSTSSQPSQSNTASYQTSAHHGLPAH